LVPKSLIIICMAIPMIIMVGAIWFSLPIHYGTSMSVPQPIRDPASRRLGTVTLAYLAEGLCANWTANSPLALRGRDDITIYPLAMSIPYGEHWRVHSASFPFVCHELLVYGPCPVRQRKATRLPECGGMQRPRQLLV
jgi:hypothetical protein